MGTSIRNYLTNSVTIINYEASNIKSLVNSFKYLGQNTIISSDLKIIEKSDKIVLPGVGSFLTGMNSLKKHKIDRLIKKKYIENKSIILGICLGMQLFFESSEEKENSKGLNLLRGKVEKFSTKIKIPHMGFNSVKFPINSKLFKNIPQNSDFYFANSFRVKFDHQFFEHSSVTKYGEDFVSAVEYKNLYGTQFHPEKSHKYGLMLLENFIKIDA